MARVARRRCEPFSFYAVLGLFVVAHVLLVSKYYHWWGGVCFGPRLLTEIQPMLLLLAIPLLRDAKARNVTLSFYVLFVWSTSVQVVGAWVYPVGAWNYSPINVDRAPERLWDWTDNPISRDLNYLYRSSRGRTN